MSAAILRLEMFLLHFILRGGVARGGRKRWSGKATAASCRQRLMSLLSRQILPRIWRRLCPQLAGIAQYYTIEDQMMTSATHFEIFLTFIYLFLLEGRQLYFLLFLIKHGKKRTEAGYTH